MFKPQLTLQDLESYEHGVFSYGYHPKVGWWVAVRGIIPDWTVYATTDRTHKDDWEWIRDSGDKTTKEAGVGLVMADDQAAEMWRS